MNRYLSIAVILITSAQMALCEELSGSQNLDQALKTTSSEPNVMSIILSLVFVICLIYVTGLIYSKLNIVGAKAVKAQLDNHDLSKVVVLSTTPLGQNQSLHVIELNNKRMLVGSSQGSISLIKDLDNTVNQIKKDTDKETEKIEIELKDTQEAEEKKIEEELAEKFNLHKKYL